MKIFRLPARCGDMPQLWQAGADNETAFLIPGEAMLAETLDLPKAVKSQRQIKQWLRANPHLSEWDSDAEILLRVGRQGERLFYWAVDQSLWQYWQQWLNQGQKTIFLLPEWALLPAPDDEQRYALQADDTILFRHETWVGGALSLENRALVEALMPRWLSLSGEYSSPPISVSFLRRQARKYVYRRPGRWFLLTTQRVLMALMVVMMAMVVELTAEYFWLGATHSPGVVVSEQKPVPKGDLTRVSRAFEQLQQIQLKGPVQLREMDLVGESVTFQLSTPLSCEEMRSRLASLAVQSAFQNDPSGCEISVNGKP